MARKPATKTAKAAPSGAKSARTRERILDAAAAVLSRKGYAGTRLTDVAEQAEIQAPAIYYYYPSREDLIEEVMYVGIARLLEHIEKALADAPEDLSPMGRIEAAVEAQLRFELTVSDYATAAIRNASQVPDELRTRYNAESEKYAEVWRRLLKDAQAEGEIREDLDPTLARLLVLGALNWTNEWWNPKRGSIDAVVKNAQSIVRHGLSPAEPVKKPARKR
ncbi:MAG TPA: TetR/AcrR family transcriptional regulator [Nocardioidaceae bacterium]|nr:TetR/AcrR family transcriptional regulator [Nocardioidaceae bacterium]